MAKNVRFNTRTVNVDGKKYRVAKVGPAQKAGYTDWLDRDSSIETFRGERILVLKPV